MNKRTLDLRKVFGMIVTYDDGQQLVSPNKSFDVVTELFPGGQSAVHVHPQQDEIYEVKEGEIQVYLGGTWRTLKAGEQVTIARGTIHAFRNIGKQKVVAFNSHNPGLRFGEMLEVIQEYINDGKITSTKGFRNLAYMSSIMLKYSDVMTTIKPPFTLIKLMAKLGKAFGYK
jgi:mannose-6-phosphate isomerase-like protein (cupin superfamily)